MEPSVSVELFVEDGSRAYNIKLGADTFEINVLVRPEETEHLAEVRTTPWLSGALRIGTCVGVAAWWCVDDQPNPDRLSILVGHDDQTWDLSVSLPIHTIDAIVREVDECASQDG